MSRRKFIFLFFEKDFWILSLCEYSWPFDCSYGALAVFYFRKQIALPINKGSCWNLPLQVLISLTIRISDCLSLAHIVEIRMNSLSVLFRDGSLSSNFSRKLFEFWVYAIILDHLDCTHGALAVFYLGKQISLPINEGSCCNLPLRVLISLTIWIAAIVHWQYFFSGSEFLPPSIKAVLGTCPYKF